MEAAIAGSGISLSDAYRLKDFAAAWTKEEFKDVVKQSTRSGRTAKGGLLSSLLEIASLQKTGKRVVTKLTRAFFREKLSYRQVQQRVRGASTP